MNDFNKNIRVFYFILATTALCLIITGLFLDVIFKMLNFVVSSKVLLIFQTAFILSGIGDIVLLFYAKNKLS